MEPQHFILCWSCVIADMQSTSCRPNSAPTAKTTNSLLPIMLVRLYADWTHESTKGYRVRRSRLISINEDEGKSTGAGVSAVYQINRGQSRSNQAFGSQPNACQLACRYGDAPTSHLEVSQTTQYKSVCRY